MSRNNCCIYKFQNVQNRTKNMDVTQHLYFIIGIYFTLCTFKIVNLTNSIFKLDLSNFIRKNFETIH